MRTIKLIALILLPIIFLLSSCSEEDPVQTPTTGTIQGKVTNSTGDSVIVGATVSTNPPTSSVTTNSSGDYSIPDVSPGQYSVTAMKVGYNSTTVTITASAGKTTTANISLNLNTTQQGLVAYYPFNGNANDESGNGHNGVGYSTTDSNNRFGTPNSSFHFNGTDSKVTVTNFSILTDNFSYSCWIKIVGNNWNNNIQSFGILGTGPANHTWDFGYHNVDRRWDLWDSTPDSWYTDYSSYATNNLLDWTYVTVVYTASSKSLYVNGVLLNSKSVVLPLPFKGDNTLVIGNFQGTVPNEQAMSGFIDDIRIYNRALTNSEIQALYHEGGWQNQNIVIPLELANWKCFTSVPTFQYLSPAAGVYEKVTDGLKIYGNGYRGNENIHPVPTSQYPITNKTIYVKWKANGGGNFMGVGVYVYPDTVNWLYQGRFMNLTTHHSYDGSIVISEDVWYYTRVAVTSNTVTATSATGNYDNNGGLVVQTQSISITHPVTFFKFGLWDTYAGTTAYAILGEARIE